MATLYWKDVNGRNWPVCSCLKAWLTAYQNELLRRGIIKHGLDLYQTIGGAQASAGYHLYGGCVDTGQTSTEAIRVARNMGGAAFGRDSRDGMDVHCHIALKGCPHMRFGPNWQVTELEAGRNGLANRGRDRGPRDGIKWPLRTYTQGIAWAKELATPKTGLRFGQFNLPDEGTRTDPKLPNAPARIKAAVSLVKATPLAFVGWNELVGITSTGAASSHAKAVDTALGDNWHMVKPTLAWNENYISYDTSLLSLVKRYDDKILPAATGGRHVTRAVFKVKATGLVFAVGQTHLVNGSTAAHEADRQRTGGLALHYMQNVAQLHDDCPIILQGDMNTSKPLKALVDAGMKRTRTYADNAPTRDDTTYTNYAKTVPSTNLAQIIDHAYVSRDFYCIGYSVRRKLTSAGVYVKPRASDHELVVSSVRHPA